MPPGDELNGKTDLKNHAAVKNPLVILPTYNEADNIASLLDALLSLPRPVRVLVVDDASPDRTADRSRRPASQTRTEPSALAVTSRAPSGLNATVHTAWVPASSVAHGVTGASSTEMAVSALRR